MGLLIQKANTYLLLLNIAEFSTIRLILFCIPIGIIESMLTHQACGACGNSPESQLGQSLELPHTGSQWDPRSSLRTRETVEGLRLTQLSLDQTSLLCKICCYDQWTPHRRRTSIHSQRSSFLVKNTETVAPQIQTPFLSPQCPLPAADPEQRGSPYLNHPPQCRGGGQSPRRERCVPRAILTPRPQSHSPSCRISL